VEKLVAEFVEIAGSASTTRRARRSRVPGDSAPQRGGDAGRRSSRTGERDRCDVRRDARVRGLRRGGSPCSLYETGDRLARTNGAHRRGRVRRRSRSHDGRARRRRGHAGPLHHSPQAPTPSASSRRGATHRHWCWADGPASLNRVKVVDPSFRNWPALEYAVLKKHRSGFSPLQQILQPLLLRTICNEAGRRTRARTGRRCEEDARRRASPLLRPAKGLADEGL